MKYRDVKKLMSSLYLKKNKFEKFNAKNSLIFFVAPT